MKLIEQPVVIQQQSMILTNQRAVFWHQQRALILSDLHLGKAAYFRQSGIAIPTNVAEQDLHRLDFLIKHYKAEQMIVVGDLIHAHTNREVESWSRLVQDNRGLVVRLIRGNHDRLSIQQWKTMGVTEVDDTLYMDPFTFIHHPVTPQSGFVVSGHIHPGLLVKLPTKKTMKFPCYVIAENEMILPAFSTFTGLDTRKIPEKAKCYAFYEEGIFLMD